jgi:hypothetical protein
LLGRLEAVKRRNGYHIARCPAHEDNEPSLSILEHDDGVAVKCHTGCTTDEILGAVGLARADLRPSAKLGSNGSTPKTIPASKTSTGEADYIYVDADGSPIFRVHRTRTKQFIQQRYDAETGKYVNGLGGLAPVLYRADKIASEYDKGEPLFIVEGEKDADRLIAEGLQATTSPMGAGKWRPEYVAQIEGYTDVRVIPDNDDPGREHAEKIAASLPGAKIVNLPGLPHKGDVSDWLDAGHAADELRGISESTTGEPEYDGRVMLGRAIVEGIDPPRILVDDVLLEGKAHSIYSGPGLGKTFLMLWLALEVMKRDLPVVLYDAENGPRLMAERLQQLGADPALLDERLHYYPFPSLDATEEGRAAYEATLDRVRPALVCFDSWIGFLAANGLDENASNDVATFAANYIAPARSRDIATLMLDHVGHEGKHARGSTRKKDELDVVWSLRPVKPFDRETVGQVVLRLEKDREAWLPRTVALTVGGDPDGNLVFSRTAGTFEGKGDDGLTPSERKTLEALETYCKTGATASDWRKSAQRLEVGERSFWNAVSKLKTEGRVLQEEKLYLPITAINCNSTAMHQDAVSPKSTALHCTPPIGVQECSTGPSGEYEPLSDDLAPGESATIKELEERRDQALDAPPDDTIWYE